jgi:hypothetical protein
MAPRARHLDETCVAAACTPAGAWLTADRVQREPFAAVLRMEGTR